MTKINKAEENPLFFENMFIETQKLIYSKPLFTKHKKNKKENNSIKKDNSTDKK